jgi:hypothetical protein
MSNSSPTLDSAGGDGAQHSAPFSSLTPRRPPSRWVDAAWDAAVAAASVADASLHVRVAAELYASASASTLFPAGGSTVFFALSCLSLIACALALAVLVQRAFVDEYAHAPAFRAAVFALSLPAAPLVPALLLLHSYRFAWFDRCVLALGLEPRKPPPFASNAWSSSAGGGLGGAGGLGGGDASVLVRLGLGAEGHGDGIDDAAGDSLDADNGAAPPESDALRDYMRRKAWAHAGFTCQALVQGIVCRVEIQTRARSQQCMSHMRRRHD